MFIKLNFISNKKLIIRLKLIVIILKIYLINLIIINITKEG